MYQVLALAIVSMAMLSDASCPSGWNFFFKDHLCYKHFRVPQTYEKAKAVCKYAGGPKGTIAVGSNIGRNNDQPNSLGMMEVLGGTPIGFLVNQMMSMDKKNVLLPTGIIGGSSETFQTGMIHHVASKTNLCVKDHQTERFSFDIGFMILFTLDK